MNNMKRIFILLALICPAAAALQFPATRYAAAPRVWHFNECAASVTRDTLSALPGTLTSTAWVTGRFGCGVQPAKKPTAGKVVIPHAADYMAIGGTIPYTLMLWLDIPADAFGSNADGGWVFQYGQANDLYYDAAAILQTNNIYVFIGKYGYSVAQDGGQIFYQKGKRYHLAFAGDGGGNNEKVGVYLNGELKVTLNCTGNTYAAGAGGHGLTLGNSYDWGGNGGSGSAFDDLVLLKGTRLTDAQIRQIYMDGLGRRTAEEH